ncbi:RHS repeat domain-containing protein, partial [Metapseudomonas otitidis]|uniref:RHS repeat domain-containing protein n=1 Tax=Metapseudomonas otitidis TaxID=319939 RepID=UPI0023F65419
QASYYVWLDSLPIAQIDLTYSAGTTIASTTLTYLHSDHLNTPRLATNQGGNLVWSWPSDAFGVGQPNNHGSTIDVILRFPGQVADAHSGLYYNYFRDYDAETGRYVESDPIGLDGGLNTYAYVMGNPLTSMDELGLSPRGERGASGGSSGKNSSSPYKHCRNHPTDPTKIICKHHQTGKDIVKPKPDDWPKDESSKLVCPDEIKPAVQASVVIGAIGIGVCILAEPCGAILGGVSAVGGAGLLLSQ